MLRGWAPWRTYERRRRIAQIPEQLAQDLEVLASALRAGTSLVQAIRIAAREGKGGLAQEWNHFLNDIRLGAALETALHNLEDRVPIASMRSFSTAVVITQASGGNLAGVLLTLAAALRQDITFQNKLSAMTAQGRLSGMIVSATPFFLMGALYVLSPELMRPFFHSSVGQLMFIGMIVLIAIGGWVIQRIVTIEV